MSTQLEQEAIRTELARIADQHAGHLRPDDVVAAAKNPASVLHSIFEWDNKKAAHAWRLNQARGLIRSVMVNITTDRTTVSTVCYVRDPDAESDEQGYVEVAKIAKDADRARAVLVSEFSRASGSLRRARELAVAFDLVGEIDITIESIDSMQTVIEASVTGHVM